MSIRDRFQLDEHGRRHFTMDAEPGSLSGKVQALGKDGTLYVIKLGPCIMTTRQGVSLARQECNLELKTFQPLRWMIKDAKTLWLDLGNNSVHFTFGTPEECDRAQEQFKEIVGAST